MEKYNSGNNNAWVLTLFGTAIGAGVLFLPIEIGIHGLWPLFVVTLLAGPMTYLAHRGLARFLMSSAQPGRDIATVAVEHFGYMAGQMITFLYFMAIYPIVLIYAVGLTNTISSFLEYQLNLIPPPRSLLSLIIVLVLIAIIAVGEKWMLRVIQLLVYPLATILFCLSLYLIPHWNLNVDLFAPPDSWSLFLITLWLAIPLVVFAFNHSPVISSFVQAQVRAHHEQAEINSRKILLSASSLLLVFVMFFVFSSVLSLSSEDLAAAKADNISVLSYLANAKDDVLLAFIGPLIAFLAIMSSFFGHYLGAREGLNGLISAQLKIAGYRVNSTYLELFTLGFMIITLWLAAMLNPSILSIIEMLSGPIIAAILFLLPMYAMRTVPALKPYAGRASNVFVTVMGSVALSAILYGLFWSSHAAN